MKNKGYIPPKDDADVMERFNTYPDYVPVEDMIKLYGELRAVGDDMESAYLAALTFGVDFSRPEKGKGKKRVCN